MNEDPLDRLLDQARDQYNPPPSSPREAMWAAIQARKGERQGMPWRQPGTIRKLAWPLGIAALLAVGFGLGRLTQEGQVAPRHALGPTTAPTLPNEAQGSTSPALAGAALQHLSRTETFLTGFRLEAQARVPDPALLAGARDLLGTTRLLLDSPDLQDQRVRQLLRELEVVLAQVAQLQAEPTREDADLIVRELDEQGVLPRLRTSIPAGPAANISGES
jgi:hypothetical protein